MSLDIYLIREETVFDFKITHNLNKMADACGLYEVLWRPEEIGVLTAGEALPILKKGLTELLENPEKYKAFNPENGWGTYDGLVKCINSYILACEKDPDLTIKVSR
jgi:hypothetical protein